ncbi:MAG: hypothetical protein EBU90_10710 [Proteobacteria bacterium]|nr:hypothetical protein [Pseudomonadota bacterium]NBP14564.1 hypothetical protein [bacterium]
MSCPFGKIFIPKGGTISPNGLFVAINSIYHYGFIHSEDSYLESGDYFKTVTPEIKLSIIPKQFTIYFISPFSIDNIIHIVIKNKNTKTILAEKYIGQINTNTQLSTIELSTSSVHDLNNDYIILEIYSINAQETDPCCDRLPSNIIISDVPRDFGGARFLCVPLEQYYELPVATTTTTSAPFIIDFLTHPTNQNVNLDANTTLTFSAISANDVDYKYWIEYSSNNGASWLKLSRPKYGKSRQVYSNVIKASTEKNGYKYRVVISSPTLKISNIATLSIIFPPAATTTMPPCVAVTTTTTTTTTESPYYSYYIQSETEIEKDIDL